MDVICRQADWQANVHRSFFRISLAVLGTYTSKLIVLPRMLEQQNDMIIIVSFFFASFLSLKIMIISCFNFAFKLNQIFLFTTTQQQFKKKNRRSVLLWCSRSIHKWLEGLMPTSKVYFCCVSFSMTERRAIMPMIIII